MVTLLMFVALGPIELLLLGAGIYFVIRFVGRSHDRPAEFAPERRPRLVLVRELGWLTAPAVVLATFAGITALHLTPLAGSTPDVRLKPAPPQMIQSDRRAERPLPFTPVPTDDRTAATTSGETARPDWIDLPRTIDGDFERVVIASQQFTTKEEAEQELAASAAALLLADLQKLHPGTSPPPSWTPNSEDIQRIAVKQRYVEVIERDFGDFFHPMYRVWWQVELSPEVRTEFAPFWREGLTISRIRVVGVVASTMALAASLLALCRRADVLTHGARRGQLALLTGGVSGIWLLAITYTVRQWLSWWP